ncbi:MAG: F0F1 ATP synthase subunit delta [Patescibacteria group bacterium]
MNKTPLTSIIKTNKDFKEIKDLVDTLNLNMPNLSYEYVSQLMSNKQYLFAKEAITSYMQENGLKLATIREKRTFLQGITSLLSEMTDVKVTVAIKAEPICNSVSNWIKSNIGSLYYVSFTEDPEILGGLIMSYNGMYLDMSVKKKLDNLFTTDNEYIKRLKESI